MITKLLGLKMSCILLWASLSSPLSPEPRNLQARPNTEPPLHGTLKVKISTSKRTFRPGETLRLHVELSNTGNTTMFVRKEIGVSDCASGSLKIHSLKGNAFPGPGVGCAMDCAPLKVDDPNKKPIASVVIGDWVPLPPDHTFSRDIWAHELGKPGKYLIGGTYSAVGLEQSCNGIYTEEEMAKLPYKLWTGQVELNPIWIVVANK